MAKRKHSPHARPSKIRPDIHRRILNFLNAARRSEDLAELTAIVKSPAEDHGPAGKDRKVKRTPIMKIDQAKLIFEERERNHPLNGFQHLSEVIGINGIDQSLLDLLFVAFGPATHGEWVEFPLNNPDGTPYLHKIEHAAVLRSGKVIMWGDPPEYFLWDPNGPDPTTSWAVFPTDYVNDLGVTVIFEPVCSGHSFLTDGQLLVCGGEPYNTVYGAWRFDPIAEIWGRTAGDMVTFRWYPTVMTLGDDSGRVLVASGVYGATSPVAMEIYSEATDSFTTISITGPIDKPFPQTYPGLNIMPNGLIFYAPTGFENCGGTPNPLGFPGDSIGDSGYFSWSDPLTGSWTDIGPHFRTKGMAALLLKVNPTDPDRVIVVGGGVPSDMATSQVIDVSGAPPIWGPTTSINYARRNANVVLLPDGTVFTCGGVDETTTTILFCELYDPVSDNWDPMDSLAVERAYHSVAVLLPNGKVLTTGGGGDCALSFNYTLEVFSPPYLFNPDGSLATRPEITSFPDPAKGEFVLHGGTFEIGTRDPCDISSVVFVRPMAVTHQTDTEQRVIQLSFAPAGPTSLSITAPDGRSYPYGFGGGHTHALAPRGFYMLFVIDRNGVPSEAKFIKLV